MATRRAVTKAQATGYRSGSRAVNTEILDSVCPVTGFNRDYARRAPKRALRPRVCGHGHRGHRGPEVRREGRCSAGEVLGGGERAGRQAARASAARAGAGAAPVGELDIDEGTAALLVGMSAATIDRRLVPARSRLVLKGRSHTKPGSLLKSRIPHADLGR